MAARSAESTRAIQEVFETDFLNTVGDFYAGNAGAHNVNGFAHQIVSAKANNVIAPEHFLKMRLAFDKANVPVEGRVAIVDGVVEATLSGYVTITSDITPFAVDVLQGKMSRGMRLMWNLFGWDIITSNRLPVNDYDDGTTQISDGVGNIFMCILDDQTKPVMGAWRRLPKVEGERNKDRARDEFVTRARYGFGLQREDTLGLVATSATNITPDKS